MKRSTMKLNRQTLFIFMMGMMFSVSSNAQINDLKNWLEIPVANRPAIEAQDFAKQALSKEDAQIVKELLVADKQQRMLDIYSQQWENRLLKFDEHEMPFFYQIFGEMPEGGRSLFISMHGGGGAPAEVNDQQYNNQKHLYDATMKNLEGVYLAPRAPGNSWDLWHKGYIDDFFDIVIQMAVINEGVNPNRVYVMGYSAGGDGTYQLAPRMADRWAGASMSAGHPGDASALNMYNTPFAIHMGANDGAYDRNKVAAEWGTKLDELETANPGAYKHQVKLHEGKGHWMELQDTIALPWMHAVTRNPVPNKVVWRQDNRKHRLFSWLATPETVAEKGGEIIAEYNKEYNEINILKNYCDTIQLCINDEMLNLGELVTIKYMGETLAQTKFNRNIINMYETLDAKGDANVVFPVVVTVVKNQEVTEKSVGLITASNDFKEQGNKLIDAIYPIPAFDKLNIRLSKAFQQDVEISLHDFYGRLLKQQFTNKQLSYINIADLPCGPYVLKCKHGKESSTAKIIKR